MEKKSTENPPHVSSGRFPTDEGSAAPTAEQLCPFQEGLTTAPKAGLGSCLVWSLRACKRSRESHSPEKGCKPQALTSPFPCNFLGVVVVPFPLVNAPHARAILGEPE